MAITDNSFTPEELSGALTANPALADHLKTALSTNKHVVRSEDEEKSFLQNYESNVIAKKTSEFATNIEKDVQELTGIEKVGDEKYHAYLKRAFGEKLGSVANMQKELEALKKAGNPDSADKARIKQLEDGIAAKEEEYKTQLSAKDTQLLQMQASFAISAAVNEVRSKFKEGIPEEAMKIVEKSVIGELTARARMEKDQIVFMKADGSGVELNTKTLAPMTAAEMIEASSLKSLIDDAKKAAGSGTGRQQQQQQQQGDGTFKGIPADVKTKTQLTEYLLKSGILDGSAEWDKAFASEEAKVLPLR